MKRIGISHRGRNRGSLLLWILLFALTAATLSCNGNDDDNTPPPQSRSWYYEHEFTQDPQLLANPDDHVILLDIDPSDGLNEVEHSIPYRFEKEESWLFAVEPNDPHITRLELLDRVGGVVAVTEPGQGGVYLNVSAGEYTLKILHDGSQAPVEGTVAFAHTQVSGTGQPARMEADSGEGSTLTPWEYPAYVALQIVDGEHDGQYLATYETTVFEDETVPVSVLKAVSPAAPGSEFSDRAHLFSLASKTVNSFCVDSTEDNYVLHSWTADAVKRSFVSISYACTSVWPIDCPDSQNNYPIPQFTEMPGFHPHREEWSALAQDAGDGAFSLLMLPFLYGQDCSFPYVAENGYVYLTGFSDGEAPGKFKVDESFRFYKDGSDIKRNALEHGEVALYEGADYSGVAVVLSESFADITLIPLDQIGSVAFGLYTNTTVELFANPEYQTSLKVVGTNATGLNITAIGSIKVFNSKQMLVSSKRCPYCNLAGVDLSDLDLDGAGLTYANLEGANLHFSSLVGANLSYAILSGTNLINTNFEGSSLLNAFLNGDETLNLAAASLTGAHLKNVNLANANLGGVDFTNANFYSTSYLDTGCAQDENNPGFTSNCASAEGANLSGATFFGAYLAGANFSGSTAKSTGFTNAVLVGANFVGAKLDWSSQTAGRTNFTGAFIGGAKFGDATVGGATFDNAYVDFATHGATMLFILSSEHTQFPGYSNSTCSDCDITPCSDCDTPCVYFSYAKPTVVPAVTGKQTICVGADPGPCGSNTDPSWTDTATPRDKSSQQNSKYTDVPPLCTFDELDTNW